MESEVGKGSSFRVELPLENVIKLEGGLEVNYDTIFLKLVKDLSSLPNMLKPFKS